MAILKIDALQGSQLQRSPFEYCVVEDFVEEAALAEIHADFPRMACGGSHPPAALNYGNAFGSLLDEMRSDDVRTAFAEHFGINLSDRPATLTIRGQSRSKDGRIHVDSKHKLITVLLYLNEGWSSDGGCLRLLGSRNLDDVLVEVPPKAGTLVAFRCARNAWHGHKPFEGPRRSIQLNWVRHEGAAGLSALRHSFSHIAKRLIPGWQQVKPNRKAG